MTPVISQARWQRMSPPVWPQHPSAGSPQPLRHVGQAAPERQGGYGFTAQSTTS
jgi:hypothetical protein